METIGKVKRLQRTVQMTFNSRPPPTPESDNATFLYKYMFPGFPNILQVSLDSQNQAILIFIEVMWLNRATDFFHISFYCCKHPQSTKKKKKKKKKNPIIFSTMKGK